MQTGSLPTRKASSRSSRLVACVAGCLLIIAATAIGWGAWSRRTAAPPPAAANASATLPLAAFQVEPQPPPTADGPFQLTAQQQRGKQIYLTGISPSGAKMTAMLGNSNTEVPAAVLTCVNCHRHDGRGKPEGGIDPSNIRWDELTKPYGSSGPHGRTRPPYDPSLLKRSIAMGLDPAGRTLDNAMPRYRMTHGDLADLVAYLMVIGRELDAGLSAQRVRVGVILAPQQLFPEMHLAVRKAVSAYVSELNRQGGVYQREIEICFSESPPRPADRGQAAIDFVTRQEVFALASSFIAGDEIEIARRLAEEGVPLVGALTLYPQVDFPLNRHVFYLGSGLPGQSRALVNYAQRRWRDEQAAEQRGNAVLLVSEDHERAGGEPYRAVASAIAAHSAQLGRPLQTQTVPAEEFDAAMLARQLQEQHVTDVFSLLSSQQNLRLLRAADECGWFPSCYLPGPLVSPELFKAPPGFDQRIFLAFPTLPSGQPAGVREFDRLRQAHDLPAANLATQFEALSGVKTLVEGLRRAGAGVSRERLIEELETLREYRTGFTPAVTFGPNRRVGARGAAVFTIVLDDKKLVLVSEWVDASMASAGL